MRWYISYIKKANKKELDGILLADRHVSCKCKKINGVYYLLENKLYCIVKDNLILETNKNLDICEITLKYSELENASKKALLRFFKTITKFEKGLIND